MQRLFRRGWLWATVLLPAVVGAGYLLVPVGAGRISQATCDKIQVGWRSEQVMELLAPSDALNILWPGPKAVTTPLGYYWDDEDGNVIVVWYRDGCVSGKKFEPTKLSFFELVKGRVSRRIRALWP
jgi:hypothetical protein